MYEYTTIADYRARTPECTGDFIGQDGEILAEDQIITLDSDDQWCVGYYDGSQTWESL